MARISVIVPAFQHASFVVQCLESIVSQSYGDIEVIVRDDASGDGTWDAIRSVTDRRIQSAVNPVNRGAVLTVNEAILGCESELIAILNSDDFFLPGKLDAQVAWLDRHPDACAVFGLPLLINERGAEISDPDLPYVRLFGPDNHAVWGHKNRFEWLRTFFFAGNGLCHPTVLIRRRVFDQVGLYDPRLTQLPDFDMWVRVASKFEFGVLEQPMTAFRILDGERNASGIRPETKARLAWETERVLHRFRSLAPTDFRRAFKNDNKIEPRPLDLALAKLALDVPTPGHGLFGVNLLFELAAADETLAREIGPLAGRVDPLGINARDQLAALELELDYLRIALPRLFKT